MQPWANFASPTAEYEVLFPLGYASQSNCGYCSGTERGPAKRLSYYANASELSPAFYQTLLDRYWRRSGKLMYRPNPRDSCCPHYTIRLDSEQFRPTRDQRQAINRFNSYVMGDQYTKEASRLYPRTKEESRRRNNEFLLEERVHEAEYEKLSKPPVPAHKFVVTLETTDCTDEKYAVYENYQRVVHKDAPEDKTKESFTRFLCQSPLRRQTITRSDGTRQRLGSYHQCYRLDGKLVAVGVLDLLPQCVSSVYFMYDESIKRFSPGKLSALREIALTQEGGYRWWYPGYYIHNCPKMLYKLEYWPQYVLDPQSLTWDLLGNTFLALLEENPYVSLFEHGKRREKMQLDDETSEEEEEDEEEEEKETSDASNGCYSFRGSMFEAKMPGIAQPQEVEKIDLSQVRVCGPSGLYKVSDLVGWDSEPTSYCPTIKFRIAELVAALGLDSVSRLCIEARGDDDEL